MADETVNYKITISGCDDSTYIYMNLTDDEADLVRQLGATSEAESRSGCQPRLYIKES